MDPLWEYAWEQKGKVLKENEVRRDKIRVWWEYAWEQKGKVLKENEVRRDKIRVWCWQAFSRLFCLLVRSLWSVAVCFHIVEKNQVRQVLVSSTCMW
jgi:uncharacterized iron-regulated protein